MCHLFATNDARNNVSETNKLEKKYASYIFSSA